MCVCVAVLIVCATGLIQGAGSEVADAVMKGDTAAVRRLLAAKGDVNAPQVDGATALHWAVYRDDVETAGMLIRAGADVGAVNREGTTPLSMAALYGNTAMIDTLLKAGADPKERGRYGETVVMLAARNGKPDAIKMLVAAGADVNAAETLRGTTALMWAAEEGHAAAVKTLVELGADVSAKSGPAGLPRNYMAQAVNVAAVQAAAKRRREAREAGRTLEEQTAYELANGLPTPTGTGSAGGNLASAQATRDARRAAAAAQAAQDAQQDVIIAGLVGGGSGGLTPLVFAAREGDTESARVLLRRALLQQPHLPRSSSHQRLRHLRQLRRQRHKRDKRAGGVVDAAVVQVPAADSRTPRARTRAGRLPHPILTATIRKWWSRAWLAAAVVV